nr:glutamate-rich protein 6B isoform X2 [Pogona vitticeps]
MSNGQNLTGSGSGEQSQAEIIHSPSEHQAADPKPSNLLLTVENVQKLQEEYPVAKSGSARESIEAYIEQSNLYLNKSETNTDEGKGQKLLDEKEKNSLIPQREGICQDPAEDLEESPKKDFQTCSLPSSTVEAQSSKRRDVADLETQTEWSYSDRSEGSSEQRGKKLDQRSMTEKEKRVSIGSEELRTGSIGEKEKHEIVLDSKVSSSPDEEADVTTLLKQEDHSITDLCHLGCCEFCNNFLKGLPTAEELEDKPDTMESFLCCRSYKEVFECVIQELLESSSPESEIDIRPHPRLSQTLMESKTKKLLKDEIEERGFENYREIFEQYMKFGTCIKIKFKLSAHPPKKKVSLKKQRPHPKELLKIDTEFQAEQLKICNPVLPVTRYYADGKIFFFLFPDGTGQVYYPSGNIAILITYERDVQFTYIVLSDSSSHAVQAFFTNQGYAACYHQNGTIHTEVLVLKESNKHFAHTWISLQQQQNCIG